MQCVYIIAKAQNWLILTVTNCLVPTTSLELNLKGKRLTIEHNATISQAGEETQEGTAHNDKSKWGNVTGADPAHARVSGHERWGSTPWLVSLEVWLGEVVIICILRPWEVRSRKINWRLRGHTLSDAVGERIWLCWLSFAVSGRRSYKWTQGGCKVALLGQPGSKGLLLQLQRGQQPSNKHLSTLTPFKLTLTNNSKSQLAL